MSVDLEILQEIRKSHCARKEDKKHNCAGTCKITPKGLELSCPICGDDKQTNMPSWMLDPKILNRAKRICSVIGLEFDNMNDDVQRQIMAEIYKDFCPNCLSTHILGFRTGFVNCSCGWSYSDYRGWEKK